MSRKLPPNTCPMIDQVIEQLKNYDKKLEEIYDLLETDVVESADEAKSLAWDTYRGDKKFVDLMEQIRTANSTLREAAEEGEQATQELQDQVDTLEEQIDELKSEVSDLQDTVADLRNQLDNLQ